MYQYALVRERANATWNAFSRVYCCNYACRESLTRVMSTVIEGDTSCSHARVKSNHNADVCMYIHYTSHRRLNRFVTKFAARRGAEDQRAHNYDNIQWERWISSWSNERKMLTFIYGFAYTIECDTRFFFANWRMVYEFEILSSLWLHHEISIRDTVIKIINGRNYKAMEKDGVPPE